MEKYINMRFKGRVGSTGRNRSSRKLQTDHKDNLQEALLTDYANKITGGIKTNLINIHI